MTSEDAVSGHRSATQAVLSLPEMLFTIFSFCINKEEKKPFNTLCAVIRVNRLWFELGTDMLWADNTASHYLFSLPQHRGIIYAPKLRLLTFSRFRIHEYFRKVKDYPFGRLKEFRIESTQKTDCNSQYLKPFLGPLTHTFRLRGPHMNMSMLRCLQKNCPQLTTICLQLKKTNISMELFRQFVQKVPFLKSVTFTYPHWETSRPSVSAELLIQLAQSQRLHDLFLPWDWMDDNLKRLAAAVRDKDFSPFPALAELKLVAPTTAIYTLAPLVENIGEIHLTLIDSKVDVCRHVSRLVSLHTLSLFTTDPTVITAADLFWLRSLSRLKNLILRPLIHMRLQNSDLESDFSDHDCDALFSHWPLLHYLEFRVECPLSTNALESLGRHCRNLAWCELSMCLNTQNLFATDYGYVLFPELISLRLGPLLGHDIMRSV